MQALNSSLGFNPRPISNVLIEANHLPYRTKTVSGTLMPIPNPLHRGTLSIGVTAMVAFLALSTENTQTLPFTELSEIGRAFSPARPVVSLSNELLPALEEMEGYAFLEDGWDGVGSVKPMDGAIRDAVAFLLSLPRDIAPPEPTVSADGTVGWFWKTTNCYASIAFSGDRRYAYYGIDQASGNTARGVFFSDRRSVPSDLLDIIRVA